jgi:hypothetical protein
MYFEHHLGREGGSMTRVAEKTGLERTHLYRKLKQLGVEPGKLGKKNAANDGGAAPVTATLVTGPSAARASRRSSTGCMLSNLHQTGAKSGVILEGYSVR